MKTYLVKQLFNVALLSALMALAGCVATDRVPPRTLNVIGDPELVFARPVAEILPQLAGATATGENGRVGNELVFWGYRLQDNSEASLFACLPREAVNCDARIARVCPAGGEELVRQMEPGVVRVRYCQTVGIARPGDLYPGCAENDRNDTLLVGLSLCQ